MPTVTHKQKLLQRLLAAPKRGEAAGGDATCVLEHLLYAVCREGASRAQADEAFANLRKAFFDWNEIRVSSGREVEDVLGNMPHPEVRAYRLTNLLKELFETTYSFDLDGLHKQGLKQAQKKLERFQGATPFVVAYTLQHGLDGHFLPLDADMKRTLIRLEVLDGDPDEAAMASLEHLVPKAKGANFCENVSEVAQHYCYEEKPRCAACPLHDGCPTGQNHLTHTQNGTHAPAKSRARG